MAALSTVCGILLLALALTDVFQTLLHPGSTGRISHHLFSAMWALARRRSRRAAGGPVMIALVIAVWVLLITVGWALIYLPHIPHGFHFDGVDPQAQHPFVEALSVSLVALTTLGYGDVVPAAGLLRLLPPLEALTGFGLLSASVSWFMAIFPALARRRAGAIQLTSLHEAGIIDGLHDLSGAQAAGIVARATRSVIELTADIAQNPEVYYFVERDERLSAPRAMEYALRLRDAALHAEDEDVRGEGKVLAVALHALAGVLQRQYRMLQGDSPDEVLVAFAGSHGHPFARQGEGGPDGDRG